MTDINLKTETPDTTLPTTGFLFGADSQAAASPSVFTVQSVATTLLGSTTLSGATITADAPVLNLEQTWNNAAVTFTGLKFNAAGTSDANSASGSLLMDLQVDTVSKFLVFKNGCFGGSVPTAGFLFVNGPALRSTVGVILKVHQTSYDVRMHSSTPFGWTPSDADGVLDTILTRRGAANLRFGAADAAAPVAQTLSVQSVVAGTSNIAGANLTITGSQGTGTGAGGSIIFQVAPAGSSGTAQNALATFLEATSARAFNLYNTTDVTTNFERGFVKWSTNVLEIGTEAGGTGAVRVMNLRSVGSIWGSGDVDQRISLAAAGYLAFFDNAGAEAFRFSSTLELKSNSTIKWSSSTSPGGAKDLGVERSAAGVLLVSNGSTGGGSLEMREQTAPAAPAANGVRIYAEDDGAGKTRLMALFATGAAQQIAIEP